MIDGSAAADRSNATSIYGSATAISRGVTATTSRALSGVAPSGGTAPTPKHSHAEHRVALPVKRSLAWCCRVSLLNKSLAHRKSQAAMEFLITYGWAILVVLAAIAALAYFGVLSPSRFLPESCTLPSTSGLACLDFTFTSSSANLFLVNGGGRDLWVNSIEVGSCSAVFGQAFPDGASHVFVLSGCDFGSAGQKIKQPFVVSYSDIISNFTKSASGSITASIS